MGPSSGAAPPTPAVQDDPRRVLGRHRSGTTTFSIFSLFGSHVILVCRSLTANC